MLHQILHTRKAAAASAVRHAGLSAIHRGLRRSEKAQFGDPRFSRTGNQLRDRDSGGDGRTAKAFEGAASLRQQQKLRKKLDRKEFENEHEDDTGPQTRRKRFLDPDFSFGKRSLVYQLKHGALKDTADSLDLPEPVRPRRTRTNDDSRRPKFPGVQRFNQFMQSGQLREASLRDNSGYSGPQNSQSFRDHRPRCAPGRSTPQEGTSVEEAPARPRNRGMMPMKITYTTAASQFLYGRSVVKAALEQGRRQLYRLYVYGGENRRDSKDNDFMIHLARARNVPVTVVPNEDQRLMDKMSMGRPHNGFVLETSPLPQIPVKSLGRLEQSPARLGFHVELDHQTKEEKMINGENTFVSKAQNALPKPFVLLFHEILDPGNLGALLRTASYMGVDAVGITSRSSSALTPVVLKSAAGAAEEVTIFTVESPVQFLEDSRAAGWKTYAAVAPPEKKLVKMHGSKFISTDDLEREAPLDQQPCILVLGNEGHGLPRPVKVAADYEISVPRFIQGSSVDSLNVSVAAGLLCHAFVKSSTTSTRKDQQPAAVHVDSDAKKIAEKPDEALF